MNKNLSYESPEIFVERFICEAGFVVSPATISDAYDEGFDDTYSASAYEAFFYGNMNE